MPTEPVRSHPHVPGQPARHPKPVIGLLGAPGSGKSHIASMMADRGCAVIDADAIAREQLNTPEVVAELIGRWGEHLVDDRGEVDRGAVAEVIFNDQAERRWLESLIHPRVHRRRETLRAAYFADDRVRAVVEDCPLLIESGLARGCDALVMVEASESVRRQRVAESRGWSPDQLSRREKTQAPLDIKRKLADYTVVNESGAESLDKAVDSVLASVLR